MAAFDRLVSAYDHWIAASLPPNVAAALLSPRSHHAPWLVLVVLALLVLLLVARVKARRRSGRQNADRGEDAVSRATNTPLWRRFLWRIRPPADIMVVDGLEIERTGKKSHAAWLGPTGAGKSASVATVRVDGLRPTLAAMPDLSDPIREAAIRLGPGRFFIWTACESTEPINFLTGTPEEVAERLSTVFRWGGTGAWMRKARIATTGVIRDIDALGRDRYLLEIAQGLELLASKDKRLGEALVGWIDRFLDVAQQFGPSMAPGGRDIARMLRRGMTVVLDVDGFDHPSLGGDVVAFGLAEAKRCASIVPGGFRLIFEEAGQLGERIDLAEPFHRAGRRRKIAVDDLTQAESDLMMGHNDGIVANLGVRVYFAQEQQSLQRMAADRLGLKPSALDPAKMADYTAWVVTGRIRRLVHFPKPPRLTGQANDLAAAGGGAEEPGAISLVRRDEAGRRTGTDGSGTGRFKVEEVRTERTRPRWEQSGPMPLPGPSNVVPSWIACSERRREIFGRLSGTWNLKGCWLWPENAGRNKAYGKVNYLNRGAWETHFLFWAWKLEEDVAQGRHSDLDVFYARHPEVPRFRWPEQGGELVLLTELKAWMRAQTSVNGLSIDHRCPGAPNPLCQNAEAHLWLATGTENSKWRHERRNGAKRLEVERLAGVSDQA